jgi:hypothetical protein
MESMDAMTWPVWLSPTMLGGLWLIWWFFGVNWKKLWPVLHQGAWAPVLLLMLITTEVWSRVDPHPCSCLSFLPNWWWQLGSVTALALVALFCGWLQLLLGCTPAEYAVNPAPVAHDLVHGHEHGHSHDHAETDDHHDDHGHEHH